MENHELSDSFELGEDEIQQFSLPRVDGGKDAWLFLGATFIFEAMIWGFPFSFGIFETYYSTHEPFSEDQSSIAAIGTTALGIMYFASPLVYVLLKKHPKYAQHCVFGGFLLVLASLIGASFANTTSQLIATQGVLYGIGGVVNYFPAILFLDEWFVQRRGLAFGIIVAGAGAAGVAIPLIMSYVLEHHGFRTALRVWAVAVTVLMTPALFFMKPRIPVRQHALSGPQKTDLGFLRSRVFWVLQLGSVVQGLGYFMPSIYISSFAQSVGFSSLDGTLAIACINAAAIIGSSFIGYLSDKYHVTNAIMTCSVGSMVAVFVFWTFATNKVVLFFFAVLYGVFANGWSSTWPGCAKHIRESGFPCTETGMMIAVFSSGKGIGAVISGPLSEALVATDRWKARAPFAYGSGYGSVIICTGVTAAFAGISWYVRRCGVL